MQKALPVHVDYGRAIGYVVRWSVRRKPGEMGDTSFVVGDHVFLGRFIVVSTDLEKLCRVVCEHCDDVIRSFHGSDLRKRVSICMPNCPHSTEYFGDCKGNLERL